MQVEYILIDTSQSGMQLYLFLGHFLPNYFSFFDIIFCLFFFFCCINVAVGYSVQDMETLHGLFLLLTTLGNMNDVRKTANCTE